MSKAEPSFSPLRAAENIDRLLRAQGQWNISIREWEMVAADIMDNQQNWADDESERKWQEFGRRTRELIVMVGNVRPDLDRMPLAELHDIQTARLLPAPAMFLKVELAIRVLKKAVESIMFRSSGKAAPANQLPAENREPSVRELISGGYTRLTVREMKKKWDIGVDTLPLMAGMLVQAGHIDDFHIIKPRQQQQLWARVRPKI